MINTSQRIQKYEIMAIIVNNLDEKKALNQVQESLVSRIKELNGKMTFEDFWGARGFAYKIKKQTWGYYTVIQFELDPSKIIELKKDLSLDTKIVRFLITKVDKRDPAPRKYTDIKKEWEALEKEKEISEIDQKKKKSSTEETKKTVAPKKSEISQEKKEKLDKKLDKILEDSSLDL